MSQPPHPHSGAHSHTRTHTQADTHVHTQAHTRARAQAHTGRHTATHADTHPKHGRRTPQSPRFLRSERTFAVLAPPVSIVIGLHSHSRVSVENKSLRSRVLAVSLRLASCKQQRKKRKRKEINQLSWQKKNHKSFSEDVSSFWFRLQ